MPVRAERHTAYRVGGAFERLADLLAAVGVPQPHRAVPPADAKRAHPELNATPNTLWSCCAAGAPIGCPVPASHNRTVPSTLAVARRRPSGLNATSITVLVVAIEGFADRLAAVGVPQPHRVVVAGRGEAVPVRTEHHTPSQSRCGR